MDYFIAVLCMQNQIFSFFFPSAVSGMLDKGSDSALEMDLSGTLG